MGSQRRRIRRHADPTISPAIHAADPQAKVLIGGLAYDAFEPGGPFVRSFLGDTLAALKA